MRILVFHGYLLRGTGSNVYNARLALALARAGHDVLLLCQERDPPPELAAAGVAVVRPEIGPVLPVYVADRYEGVEARTFARLTDAEVATYVERNVAAVAEAAAAFAPEAALANHLVMGPLILARALAEDVPYAVKIHGSALEYTVKTEPLRFLPAAREGLARARTVLVGSRHTAESLWAAMDDPGLAQRTRLGPPGVDVAEFRPRARHDAAEGFDALRRRLDALAAAQDPSDPGIAPSAFTRDAREAARALAAVDPGRDRLVAFVGKLIVSKGIDLLIAAWPLVLERVPGARLVVVGFGAYRPGVERLLAALGAGDLDAVAALAARGRGEEHEEGRPPGAAGPPLRWLQAFLDDLGDARGRYAEAARSVPGTVVLTGRLEHDELAPLLAACEAQVVPSTFPEAFGMVAAEAAACGALPVVALHSGLAEVRETLARAVPAAARPSLGFEVGPRAVRDLARALIAWLEAPEDLRAATRDALVATARARFSWDGVARGVVAAAQGDRDALPSP